MKKTFWWLLTIGWAYLILYLTSIPNFSVSDDTLVSLIISSGGHFFFFGMQAVLLYYALAQHELTNTLYAIVPTSLFGLLDELHQRIVPGRSADPMDWVLDTLGAITFLGILTLINSKNGRK